jgi:hypothetical protein
LPVLEFPDEVDYFFLSIGDYHTLNIENICSLCKKNFILFEIVTNYEYPISKSTNWSTVNTTSQKPYKEWRPERWNPEEEPCRMVGTPLPPANAQVKSKNS